MTRLIFLVRTQWLKTTQKSLNVANNIIKNSWKLKKKKHTANKFTVFDREYSLF